MVATVQKRDAAAVGEADAEDARYTGGISWATDEDDWSRISAWEQLMGQWALSQTKRSRVVLIITEVEIIRRINEAGSVKLVQLGPDAKDLVDASEGCSGEIKRVLRSRWTANRCAGGYWLIRGSSAYGLYPFFSYMRKKDGEGSEPWCAGWSLRAASYIVYSIRQGGRQRFGKVPTTPLSLVSRSSLLKDNTLSGEPEASQNIAFEHLAV